MSFKAGDRVVLVNINDTTPSPKMAVGLSTGTVVAFEGVCGAVLVGVHFDEDIDGHDLCGACPMGYGWWVWEENIELIKEEEETPLVELCIKDLFE